MKTHFSPARQRQQVQSGLAVIVVMAIVFLILVFLAGNVKTLDQLEKRVRLVEVQQNRRWQSSPPPATNAAAAVPPTGQSQP
jgi:hypothetical protein